MFKTIVMVIVPMILSLTVHEFAHAWAAFKLGDDTASRQGRMTLNPLAHIDPIGTLLIPILPILTGGQFSLIGWAKPVPVSPHRFNRKTTMRKGMIITAMAGPLSNLIIAFLSAGILSAMEKFGLLGTIHEPSPLYLLMFHLFYMNIGLAIFNMLPIPPLDGSRLLPLDIQAKLSKYTMFIMLGLLIAINFLSGSLQVPVKFVAVGFLNFWGIFF